MKGLTGTGVRHGGRCGARIHLERTVTRMYTSRALLVAAAAAISLGVGRVAAQSPDSVQRDLASAVAGAMKATGTPGAQVLVRRNGRTLLDRGFGVRSLADSTPVDPQTRFEIGSITKQFTAAAILQLAAQKKLSLDDSLGKFVPNYPAADAVTLRQLLWQVTGIPNYTATKGFVRYSTTHPGGLTGVLGLIRDKPLRFAPGTKWMYSNSNYALLGRVVAVASGMPWERYIATRIFGPAGMTHSTFNDHESGVRDMATGYIKKDGKLEPSLPMGNWAMGAGAIVSTADDLSRWDGAFFGGRVVAAADVKVATTSGTLTDGKPTGYGFGWVLDEHDGQARTWHNGGTFGFLSMNELFPALGERIIVLVNDAAGNPAAIADAIFNALNPRLAAADTVAAPGEDAAVTKLARQWWTAFRSGKIDRSRLTKAMSEALTPSLLAQSQAGLKHLGDPVRWIFRSKRESGEATVYVYRVTFASGQALHVVMALTANGKLAGYSVRPG